MRREQLEAESNPMRVRITQLRPLVIITLLCFAAANSACAQEKAKRMVPGPSVKELVPASPNEKEDGISKIIIGQLFKPGNAEYTRIGAGGLKDAPPLPTGYSLFKDLAFDVKTDAITSGYHVFVFSLPSVETEADFKKLGVLHLEVDEMSPSGKSWVEVTMFPGGWDDHFHQVSKTQYDSLLPDFKTKHISAISTQLGLFVIASYQDIEPRSTDPFTRIDLTITTSPDPAAVGQQVAHIITVENKGPNAAGDVNLKYELNHYYEYVSSTTDRGICKRSDLSTVRVLCHLGPVNSGDTVRITIMAHVPRDISLVKDRIEAGNVLELVFKERPTDPVEERNQLFKEYNATILRAN